LCDVRMKRHARKYSTARKNDLARGLFFMCAQCAISLEIFKPATMLCATSWTFSIEILIHRSPNALRSFRHCQEYGSAGPRTDPPASQRFIGRSSEPFQQGAAAPEWWAKIKRGAGVLHQRLLVASNQKNQASAKLPGFSHQSGSPVDLFPL